MVSPFDNKKATTLKCCPVCGKRPKIKQYAWDYGERLLIEIKCKPFFKKEHCCVSWGGSASWVHLEDAIECWNKKVMYIEDHKKP